MTLGYKIQITRYAEVLLITNCSVSGPVLHTTVSPTLAAFIPLPSTCMANSYDDVASPTWRARWQPCNVEIRKDMQGCPCRPD